MSKEKSITDKMKIDNNESSDINDANGANGIEFESFSEEDLDEKKTIIDELEEGDYVTVPWDVLKKKKGEKTIWVEWRCAKVMKVFPGLKSIDAFYPHDGLVHFSSLMNHKDEKGKSAILKITKKEFLNRTRHLNYQKPKKHIEIESQVFKLR